MADPSSTKAQSHFETNVSTLVARWNLLQDDEEVGADGEVVERAKEQWFLDALLFLRAAPTEQHSWCHLSDVSSLVLESFYHYYSNPNEALTLVWKRWCQELRGCDTCVHVYHRSKEALQDDFDEGPEAQALFAILERMDQERVAQQLRDAKALFDAGTYDPEQSSHLIFATVYELLNFPVLLEDGEIDRLVAPVLAHMDQVHALSIGEYRPAGVYSLLFHNSPEARAVATRLSKTTSPFRDGQEMDVVQPILGRKVVLLHALAGSTTSHVADKEAREEVDPEIFGGRPVRPSRTQEHLPLWLGFASFMELLEPAAMLGGLVEPHPDVVSIVLNQASEPANPAFNVALKCLKLLFQGVGYRVWWDTDFTPRVVRSTLVSHCNTTLKESLHLTIFPLFEAFLRSLEMDRNTNDDFETERGILLKFLTRQVANSDTFSGVVKGKALEVAFRIIQRGYSLDPPVPPSDSAHMWGPLLVSTLNNPLPQESLRIQAVELTATILVFDSSALAATVFAPSSGFTGRSEPPASVSQAVDSGREPLEVSEGQPAEAGWGPEWAALENAAGGYAKQHEHTPALWQALFLGTSQRVNFPGLLTKAALWAAERLALLEEAAGLDPDQTTAIGAADPKDWPFVVVENKQSVVNVVVASGEAIKELVVLYRRCLVAYLEGLRQRSVGGDVAVLQALEWETWIAESLTILLLDPTALIRNVDREILKYFTADATLDGGLRALCTDPPAARAVSEGIFEASGKLLHIGFPKCARASQLLCFYATKLFRINSPSEPNAAPLDGGALWAIVCARISEGLWPLLLRILEGSRPAAESFEPGTSAQSLLPLADYLISASLFQRLVVHVLEAFVAAWPFSRHRALPGTAPRGLSVPSNRHDDANKSGEDVNNPGTGGSGFSTPRGRAKVAGFGSPARTPSVFDLVEGGRLKPTGSQGDEWLIDFVKWGHVTRPAVRRRWMECIELVGCEMVDGGMRLPVGARATIRELLAPTSSLTDEQRLVLSQFFPHEAPGNLGLSSLDALPTRPTLPTPSKPVFPRQPSFETPPRGRPPAAGQSRLTTTFLEGGTPPQPAGFFQLPPSAGPSTTGSRIVIDLDADNSPVTQADRRSQQRMYIDLVNETETETKPERKPEVKTDTERGRFARTAAQTVAGETSTSGRDDAADGASKMAASLAAFASRTSYRTPSWRGASSEPNRHPAGGSKASTPKAKRTPPSTPNRTSPMYSKRARPRLPQQAKIDSMLNRHPEDEQLEAAWAAADGLRGAETITSGSKTVTDRTRKSEALEALEKHDVATIRQAERPPPASTGPRGSSLEPEGVTNRRGAENETVHNRGLPAGAPKLPRPPLGPPRKTMRIELPGEGQTASVRARGRKFGATAPLAPPKPDEWYKQILVMDFFRVVDPEHSENAAARPPNKGPELLVQVPDAFESESEYVRTFRPLLMEEFKAQLQRVHDESGSNSEMLEIGHFKLLSLARRDDFWDANFVAEEDAERSARECSELDLLLLTKQAPSKGDPSRVHVLAKVERRDQRDTKAQKRHCTVLVLKLFLPINEPRLLKVKQLLTDGSKWFVTKLFSMVPQMREFQAMSAFHTLPLRTTLLNPSTATPRQNPSNPATLSKLPAPLLTQLQSRFNDSQLAAIATAVRSGGSRNQELALVQGPPGTGKTSTIMGILSALLNGPGGNVVGTERVPGGTVGLNRPVKAPVRLSEKRESAILTAQAQKAWQQAEEAKEMLARKGKEVESGGVQTGAEGAPRILLCAQSNAAVDELVARLLKSGVLGADGLPTRPSIVRVGNIRTVHSDSKPVHIDTLVEAETRAASSADNVNKPQSEEQKRVLRNSLVKISSEMTAVQKKSAPGEADGDLTLKKTLDGLYDKRRAVQSEIISLEAAGRKARENERSRRAAARRKVLREASIVVTTLSGCGGDVYSACKESKGGEAGGLFDAVIIDEAAQALEPATLIPLQLLVPRGGRCIMIGDPKQLPATVLSRAASSFNYERSLFERLQRGGFPVTMLSTQYRMHPEIRHFPSVHFYGGLLTDGENVTSATRAAAFHERPVFGPYAFFDVIDGQERSRGNGSSLSNDEEAAAVLELYQAVRRSYPGEDLRGRLGVITPYKQQLEALRRKFRDILGERAASDVEFNTVDGFQGREVDVLILSTVRSSNRTTGSSSIGFVADVRRMNVALTRARKSLWIVGNSAALKRNPHWADLLSDAAGRDLVFEARRPYSSLFASSGGSKRATTGPDARGGAKLTKPASAVGTSGKKPGENVFGGDMPRANMPGGSVPSGKVSGGNVPGGKVSGGNVPSETEKGEKRPLSDLIPLGRGKKPKLGEGSDLRAKRKADVGDLEVPAPKVGRLEVAGSSKPPEVRYSVLREDVPVSEAKIAEPGNSLKEGQTPPIPGQGPINPGQEPVTTRGHENLFKAPKKGILKKALGRLEAAGGTIPVLPLPPRMSEFAPGASPSPGSVFALPLEVPRSSPSRPAPLEIPPQTPSSMGPLNYTSSPVPIQQEVVPTPLYRALQQQGSAGGVETSPDMPPGFNAEWGTVNALQSGRQDERNPPESPTARRTRELQEKLGSAKSPSKQDGTNRAEPSPRGNPRELRTSSRPEPSPRVSTPGSRTSNRAEASPQVASPLARTPNASKQDRAAERDGRSTSEERERRNRENARRFGLERSRPERRQEKDRGEHRGSREKLRSPRDERESYSRERGRSEGRRPTERSPTERGLEFSPRSAKEGSAHRHDRERRDERGRSVSQKRDTREEKKEGGAEARSARHGDRDAHKPSGDRTGRKSLDEGRRGSREEREGEKESDRGERTGEGSRSDGKALGSVDKTHSEKGSDRCSVKPTEKRREEGREDRARGKSKERETQRLVGGSSASGKDMQTGKEEHKDHTKAERSVKSPEHKDKARDSERRSEPGAVKQTIEATPREEKGTGPNGGRTKTVPVAESRLDANSTGFDTGSSRAVHNSRLEPAFKLVARKNSPTLVASSDVELSPARETTKAHEKVPGRSLTTRADLTGERSKRDKVTPAEPGGASPVSITGVGSTLTPRVLQEEAGAVKELERRNGTEVETKAEPVKRPERRNSTDGAEGAVAREPFAGRGVLTGRKETIRRGSGEGVKTGLEKSANSGVARKPDCRYWPNCDKGDACRFAHGAVTRPCRFFQRGYCRDGAQCPYVHGDPGTDIHSGERNGDPQLQATTAEPAAKGYVPLGKELREKVASKGRSSKSVQGITSGQVDDRGVLAPQQANQEAQAEQSPTEVKADEVPGTRLPEETKGPSMLPGNDDPSLTERKRLREEAAALLPAGAFRSQSARLVPASMQSAYAMPRSLSDVSRRKTLPLGEGVKVHAGTRGTPSMAGVETEEGEMVDELAANLDRSMRKVHESMSPKVYETISPKVHETMSPHVEMLSNPGFARQSSMGRPTIHGRLDVPGFMGRGLGPPAVGFGGDALRVDDEMTRFQESVRNAGAREMRTREELAREAQRDASLGGYRSESQMLDQRDAVRLAPNALIMDARDLIIGGVDRREGDGNPMMRGVRIEQRGRAVLQDERDVQGPFSNPSTDLREVLRQRNTLGRVGREGAHRSIHERLLGRPP